MPQEIRGLKAAKPLDEVTVQYFSRKDTVLFQFLNTIFDGVYVTDRKRRIVFWNKGAELITGYSAAEVVGHCCSEDILCHIDENGMPLCRSARCPLACAMKTRKPLRAKVYPLHKSGRRFPVMTHVAPIVNAQGKVIGAVEVFRDTSQEEEFRVLTEKFQRLATKYLSAATLDHIQQSVREQEQEPCRGDYTVMFIDVVAFTSFAEQAQPSQVNELLNTLFLLCEIQITAHHGDIDTFIGDGVMTVFRDANDAVSAGRAILRVLRQTNRRRERHGLQSIHVHIGANSGLAVKGAMGGAHRREVTVVGDMVNTAARVQMLSESDTLYITEATRARLRTPDGFVFVDHLRVKGRRELVPVYRWNDRRNAGAQAAG